MLNSDTLSLLSSLFLPFPGSQFARKPIPRKPIYSTIREEYEIEVSCIYIWFKKEIFKKIFGKEGTEEDTADDGSSTSSKDEETLKDDNKQEEIFEEKEGP